MLVAICLYDRFTALDAIGPYDVLQLMPDTRVKFVGERTGIVRSESAQLGIMADYSLDDVPSPDIVVVPGGIGSGDIDQTHPITQWLTQAHSTTTVTTSVCSGALIMGTAGLLTGLEATTHWALYSELQSHGAIPTTERVVEHWDQRVVTAAGVSSGIDMALRLASRLHGDDVARAIQLAIEYDPAPPFDSGSAQRCDDVTIQLAFERLLETQVTGMQLRSSNLP